MSLLTKIKSLFSTEETKVVKNVEDVFNSQFFTTLRTDLNAVAAYHLAAIRVHEETIKVATEAKDVAEKEFAKASAVAQNVKNLLISDVETSAAKIGAGIQSTLEAVVQEPAKALAEFEKLVAPAPVITTLPVAPVYPTPALTAVTEPVTSTGYSELPIEVVTSPPAVIQAQPV